MTELWVYVELCREGIRPVTFELLGKAAELSARCGGRVTAVALGDCDTGALIASGADRVLVGEGLPFPAEDGLQAQALAELCRRHCRTCCCWAPRGWGVPWPREPLRCCARA